MFTMAEYEINLWPEGTKELKPLANGYRWFPLTHYVYEGDKCRCEFVTDESEAKDLARRYQYFHGCVVQLVKFGTRDVICTYR